MNPIKRWEHACFQRFLRFRGYHKLVQNIVSFCTRVGQKLVRRVGQNFLTNFGSEVCMIFIW